MFWQPLGAANWTFEEPVEFLRRQKARWYQGINFSSSIGNPAKVKASLTLTLSFGGDLSSKRSTSWGCLKAGNIPSCASMLPILKGPYSRDNLNLGKGMLLLEWICTHWLQITEGYLGLNKDYKLVLKKL